MFKLPSSLQQAIDFFERLPGIGPKSAKRLGFQLLKIPQEDLEEFSNTLKSLKSTSLKCEICLNLSESPKCTICEDQTRNKNIITVVEDVLDLLSIEHGGKYDGLYHVLHGRIDPLNYVGPDDIAIAHLIKRIDKHDKDKELEIILATNPNTEGEATAMYIRTQINELVKQKGLKVKITRIAYGLPIGADMEYADHMTLNRALEGRRDF